MLDIITYCFTCTYTAFAHFPTSCQALRDILFGLICTLVINLSDTSPAVCLSQKSLLYFFCRYMYFINKDKDIDIINFVRRSQNFIGGILT